VKKIHTIIINITLCKMFLQKFKRKLQLKKEEIPSRNSKQSEN
jgi:hypothetical protein